MTVKAAGRSSRRAAALVSAIIVVGTLTGCGSQSQDGFTWPGSFDDIDSTVADVDLGSLGDVVFEGRFGTTEFTSTVYYFAVVETPEGLGDVREKLTDLGYEPLGPANDAGQELWTNDLGEGYTEVRLRPIDAGEDGTIGGRDVPFEADADGFVVRISD